MVTHTRRSGVIVCFGLARTAKKISRFLCNDMSNAPPPAAPAFILTALTLAPPVLYITRLSTIPIFLF